MLVLTRKRDEVIRIADNIVIRVIRTGKSSVKLGVDAPAHVKVVRGEIGPQPTTQAGHNAGLATLTSAVATVANTDAELQVHALGAVEFHFDAATEADDESDTVRDLDEIIELYAVAAR